MFSTLKKAFLAEKWPFMPFNVYNFECQKLLGKMGSTSYYCENPKNIGILRMWSQSQLVEHKFFSADGSKLNHLKVTYYNFNLTYLVWKMAHVVVKKS